MKEKATGPRWRYEPFQRGPLFCAIIITHFYNLLKPGGNPFAISAPHVIIENSTSPCKEAGTHCGDVVSRPGQGSKDQAMVIGNYTTEYQDEDRDEDRDKGRDKTQAENRIVDGCTRLLIQKLITHYAGTPSADPAQATPHSAAQWHQLLTESGICVQYAPFPGKCRAAMVRHASYGWLCVVNSRQDHEALPAALCCAFCQFLMSECPLLGEGCPPAVAGAENDVIRVRLGRQVAAELCC